MQKERRYKSSNKKNSQPQNMRRNLSWKQRKSTKVSYSAGKQMDNINHKILNQYITKGETWFWKPGAGHSSYYVKGISDFK